MTEVRCILRGSELAVYHVTTDGASDPIEAAGLNLIDDALIDLDDLWAVEFETSPA